VGARPGQRKVHPQPRLPSGSQHSGRVRATKGASCSRSCRTSIGLRLCVRPDVQWQNSHDAGARKRAGIIDDVADIFTFVQHHEKERDFGLPRLYMEVRLEGPAVATA
jgi:hypothetical protein